MSNLQTQNEILPETPETPDVGKIEEISPTTEGTGENENTPFVKTPGLSSVVHSSKPINLTFKDLSYSVQVKNSKKQVSSQGKCESSSKSLINFL